tara:strand:- start:159 stop:404 length:246 start_codon:yes stop_codon:yes gene_type:complete
MKKYMTIFLKKVSFSIVFNLSLISVLIVGIQNSSNKSKVNFLTNETVNLPVSFIIGVSFICGSLSGSLISLSVMNKKTSSS